MPSSSSSLPSCGCANLKPGIAWVTDFTAPCSACFHPPMISSNDAMRTLHSVHPPNWSSILPFAMDTPHNKPSNTIQRSLPTIQCARSTAPTLLCFLLQCTHHTKYKVHYAHNTRHVHAIQYTHFTHYTHRSTQCVLHTHYLQTDRANYRVVFPLHCS